MKILSLAAAAAILAAAMPIGAASAEPHHGWHKQCTWVGHGHHKHQVCRRVRWEH